MEIEEKSLTLQGAGWGRIVTRGVLLAVSAANIDVADDVATLSVSVSLSGSVHKILTSAHVPRPG